MNKQGLLKETETSAYKKHLQKPPSRNIHRNWIPSTFLLWVVHLDQIYEVFFWWTSNHLILLHFIGLTAHVALWGPSWNTLWLPSDPTAGSLFGFQGIGFGGEGESWCAFRSCLYMECCHTQRSCMKDFSYNPWGKAALKVESELECAVSQVYFCWL